MPSQTLTPSAFSAALQNSTANGPPVSLTPGQRSIQNPDRGESAFAVSFLVFSLSFFLFPSSLSVLYLTFFSLVRFHSSFMLSNVSLSLAFFLSLSVSLPFSRTFPPCLTPTHAFFPFSHTLSLPVSPHTLCLPASLPLSLPLSYPLTHTHQPRPSSPFTTTILTGTPKTKSVILA